MSAEGTLVRHRGAREVGRQQLALVQCPPAQGRWKPVPHIRVLDQAEHALANAGYSVDRMSLALSRDDAKFFGTLTLRTPLSNGVSLAVGIRSSTDKSISLQWCCGSRVFVCDNLAFSAQAPKEYAEATKAVGTVFLLLDVEGRVSREFRVMKPSRKLSANGNGHANGNGGGKGEVQPPLTPADLSDGQLAATFTHQALLVREALLQSGKARKRVLALILHDKVRSEALAIRQDANGTTIHATNAEEFKSAALQRLREKRAAVDPLKDVVYAEDVKAYDALSAMPDGEVNKLIDVLVVGHLTAHLQRRTNLVHRLACELSVDLRKHWRPDVDWLSRYRKFQLAQLIGELIGPTYVPENERRNKTELVDQLAKLFTDAAEGKLEDATLAERVNRWLPANMREDASDNDPE